MMYDLSRTERQHLAITRETLSTALVAKRCTCRKATTAKQLDQHGKCVGCQFDERAATLQPEDLEILRHMLRVVPINGAKPDIRNEYLCNRRDLPSLKRLAAAGFARAGAALLQLQYFHATELDCRVAGLDAKRTRVALSLGARP